MQAVKKLLSKKFKKKRNEEKQQQTDQKEEPPKVVFGMSKMGGSKSTAETSKPPDAAVDADASTADEDETLYTPQPSSSGASLLEAGSLKVSGSEFPKITLRKPLSSEDTLPRMRLQEMNLSSESEDTDSEDGTFAPLASGFDVTKTGLYMSLQQNKELRQKNATPDLTKLTQRTQASDTPKTEASSGVTSLRDAKVLQIVGDAPIQTIEAPLIPERRAHRPPVEVPAAPAVPPPVLPRRHTYGLKPAPPVTRSSSILSTPSASPMCQEKNRAESQFEQHKKIRQKNAKLDLTKLTQRTQASDTPKTEASSGVTSLRDAKVLKIVGASPISRFKAPLITERQARRPPVELPASPAVPPPVLPRRRTYGLKPAPPVTRSGSILSTPSASPMCQEKNRAEYQFEQHKKIRQNNATLDLTNVTQRTQASDTPKTEASSGVTSLRDAKVLKIVGATPVTRIKAPLIPERQARRPPLKLPAAPVVPPPVLPRRRTYGLKSAPPVTRSSSILSTASASPMCQEKNRAEYQFDGLKPASPVTRSSSILSTPSASPKCQEKNRAEHQFGKVVKERFHEDLEACSSSSSSSGTTDCFDSVTRIWITINYYLRRWCRRVIRELLQIHERMMQEDLPWRSRGRNRRQEPPY